MNEFRLRSGHDAWTNENKIEFLSFVCYHFIVASSLLKKTWMNIRFGTDIRHHSPHRDETFSNMRAYLYVAFIFAYLIKLNVHKIAISNAIQQILTNGTHNLCQFNS